MGKYLVLARLKKNVSFFVIFRYITLSSKNITLNRCDVTCHSSCGKRVFPQIFFLRLNVNIVSFLFSCRFLFHLFSCYYSQYYVFTISQEKDGPIYIQILHRNYRVGLTDSRSDDWLSAASVTGK